MQLDITVPIIAKSNANGRRIVHGIASDGSLDMQNEIVDVGGLAGSIPYLKQWGKFNDDHSKTFLGEVLDANITTKGALVQSGVMESATVRPDQYGEPVLYVRGELYKGEPRSDHYWRVLKAGGRLGFSIQGRVTKRGTTIRDGKPINVLQECFVNQIAITGQPVNPHTWMGLAKSFGGNSALLDGLRKALETGSGIITEGVAPGVSALRGQSLECVMPKKKKKRRIKQEETMDVQKALAELRSISLVTPSAICAAWRMANEPELAKSVASETLREIKRNIHRACSDYGLTASIEAESNGIQSLTKSLSESDIATLEWIETKSESDFEQLLDVHDEAIIKAFGQTDDDEDDGEEEDVESDGSDEDEEDGEEEEEEEEPKSKKTTRKPPFPPADDDEERKSFGDRMYEDDEVAEAIEMSDFLGHMTNVIDKSFGDVYEAINDVRDTLGDDLVKSITEGIASKVGEALGEVLAPMLQQVDDMKKSLEGFGMTPNPSGAYRVQNRLGDVTAMAPDMVKSLIAEACVRGMATSEEVTLAELYPNRIPQARITALQAQINGIS